MPELKQDLRSYFDRLVEEAEELAISQPAPAPRTPVRPGRWFVAAAAALLVVVVVAGTAVVLRGGNEDSTIEASARAPEEVSPDELLAGESNLEVFMIVAATRSEVAAVRQAVLGNASVDRVAFLSKKAALREYRRQTRDNPALSDDITPDVLPVSFRIELRDCSAKANLHLFLGQLPGVDEVQLTAGLSHKLARKYEETSNGRGLPPKTLHGRCGGVLQSRADLLREAERSTGSTP